MISVERTNLYDFYIVSVDVAKEQVETAKEVVEMVDKYLQKKTARDTKAEADSES